jgi:hypothetical protein
MQKNINEFKFPSPAELADYYLKKDVPGTMGDMS